MIYILRGLPGSGKSTWAKTKGRVWSADTYHMDHGTYKYDPGNVKHAHNWCLRQYLNDLTTKINGDLIVDNTNTTALELAPYVRVAEALKLEYKILLFWVTPEVSVQRNIHNVPFSTIIKMYKNLLDPIPWPQEEVS